MDFSDLDRHGYIQAANLQNLSGNAEALRWDLQAVRSGLESKISELRKMRLEYFDDNPYKCAKCRDPFVEGDYCTLTLGVPHQLDRAHQDLLLQDWRTTLLNEINAFLALARGSWERIGAVFCDIHNGYRPAFEPHPLLLDIERKIYDELEDPPKIDDTRASEGVPTLPPPQEGG